MMNEAVLKIKSDLDQIQSFHNMTLHRTASKLATCELHVGPVGGDRW